VGGGVTLQRHSLCSMLRHSCDGILCPAYGFSSVTGRVMISVCVADCMFLFCGCKSNVVDMQQCC
jgi:hypothetical protein